MNVDGVVPARRYDDSDRDAHPEAHQGQNSARGGQQSRGGGTADRAAGELMRESGIDPGSEMSRDELPF
ncbi:hypothetical protein ACQKQD_24110 [Methylobacterium sp. NPDC080182]|uniref:hypothetical protein n=1 Tax=Methylobacterium sp. NPDC080182 TaxID=3390590 RepID=UPI003D08A201